MPLSGFSPLRNAGGQSFRQPANPKAKTFSLTWDRLGTLLEQYQGYGGPGRVDRAEIDSIVLDELYDLGKNVLVPWFSNNAPLKMGIEGGGDAAITQAARVMAKRGWGGSPTSWTHHGQYLKDQIESRRSTDPLGLSIRMPWFGLGTIEGTGALPDRPDNHPYKFEMPGGQVIYSTKRGPSTTWMQDGMTARYRMDWAKDTYRAVQQAGWIAQAATNIEIRTFIEVIFPGLKGQEAIDRAKAFRSAFTTSYVDMGNGLGGRLVTSASKHTQFSDYKALRLAGREGARPGAERLAKQREQTLLHRRLTRAHGMLLHEHAAAARRAAHPNASTAERRAVTRLEARLRRSENALNFHNHGGTTHIPFGRHR